MEGQTLISISLQELPSRSETQGWRGFSQHSVRAANHGAFSNHGMQQLHHPRKPQRPSRASKVEVLPPKLSHPPAGPAGAPPSLSRSAPVSVR